MLNHSASLEQFQFGRLDEGRRIAGSKHLDVEEISKARFRLGGNQGDPPELGAGSTLDQQGGELELNSDSTEHPIGLAMAHQTIGPTPDKPRGEFLAEPEVEAFSDLGGTKVENAKKSQRGDADAIHQNTAPLADENAELSSSHLLGPKADKSSTEFVGNAETPSGEAEATATDTARLMPQTPSNPSPDQGLNPIAAAGFQARQSKADRPLSGTETHTSSANQEASPETAIVAAASETDTPGVTLEKATNATQFIFDRAAPNGSFDTSSDSLGVPDQSIKFHSVPDTAAIPIRADAGARVVQLLVQHAGNLPSGPVEIVLNPEELGRIRMRLQPGEDSMNVIVAVERPETMDLLRRHIETLGSELRNFGYRDVSFEFFNQGGENPDGSGQYSEADTQPDQRIDPPEEYPPQHLRVQISADAGLDLRI